MVTFQKNEDRNIDTRKESLQNLANLCKEAYESGLTLKEVHFVSGAAWADFLDPPLS
ncbi:MAG: hypothetical protein VST68_13520 [Nitrospirota bacterium]|nr:hypothetical protein [Nitrospirota bacterium]